MNKQLSQVVIGLVVGFCASVVAAEEAKSALVEVTQKTSKGVIEEGLFPETVCEAAERKGIKCGGFPVPKVFEFGANFTFSRGTAALTDKAKEVLASFGEVMKARKGSDARIKIVGHTDATGSEAGNQKLSLDRATAVKTFLVSEYGVPATAIQVDGMASTSLKRSDDPANAQNRRVEISRVTAK